MLNNLIFSKKKSLFEKELEAGNVLDEAIVFIEDTKEIWNHGVYFDGSVIDLSNIELSIQNLLNNKADKSEIPEAVTEDIISNWGFAKQEDTDLPQINQTELVYTIQPNVFNVWGEVATLDITLGEEQEGIVNEFLFQFTSGETPTTLILPDTIKWVNDAPEIEANMTYQCSIINNIGIICGAL